MTHPNHQTNGASLEDCHTNFFALTDLCGIKWRKLVWPEGPEGQAPPAGEVVLDPVLLSFSRCLHADILCVWRRVGRRPPPPDDSALLDAPLGAPPPPVAPSIVVHPPLALNAAKELWIFWYGEEPDLSNLVSPDLLATESEQGSWESGLSYECRSLLFKALHNLIERCLLSRDLIRLGRWFVLPYEGTEEVQGKSPHLSFLFSFFVHGESTVCASVDVRQHPPVRTLSSQVLQQAQSSQAGVPVILAPFGLAGALTGQSYKAVDQRTSRLLEDWKQFYPIDSRNSNCDDSSMPQAVEVIVGGVKMRYPACYVLVTDVDDTPNNSSAQNPKAAGLSVSDEPSPIVPVESPCLRQQSSASSWVKQELPSPLNIAEITWQDSMLSPPSDPSDVPPGHWDFVDPTRKLPCTCSKCRQGGPAGPGGPKEGSRALIPFHQRAPPRHNQPAKPAKPAKPASRLPCGAGHTTPMPERSPQSAAPSPLPNPNSVQPASVPPAEPTMPTLSPQPSSSSLNSAHPGPGPATPPPAPGPGTPAHTPVDTHGPKSVSSVSNQVYSPYQGGACASVSSVDNGPMTGHSGPPSAPPPSATQGQVTTPSGAGAGGGGGGGAQPAASLTLKRPVLAAKEHEHLMMEDETLSDHLYDYSQLDVWLNYPVKKFKPSDIEQKPWSKSSNPADIYPTVQPPASTSPPLNGLPATPGTPVFVKAEVKQEPMCESDPYEFDEEHNASGAKEGFKRHNDGGKEDDRADNAGKCVSGSLFTSEGLQASLSDLDQIFDNSDASSDETMQVSTPPGSNKHEDSSCNMRGPRILRPEELSKMFPTPPSLEHNPAASPCGGQTDIDRCDFTDLSATRLKQEIYPNMGSPQEEAIDDWSYVFRPSTIFKFVGSSKYAPLRDLPSQDLPPVSLPGNCSYKPSWLYPPAQEKAPSSHHMPNPNAHHPHPHHPPVPHSHRPSQPPTPIPPGPTTPLTPHTPMTPVPHRPGMSPMPHRPGLSPISPATHFPQSPSVMQAHRATPVCPPPPPAPGPGPPPPYSPTPSSTSSYLPKNVCSIEVNSLIMNILLSDTALNIFRDHNFDSCTVCVCNSDDRKVACTIRGADAGVYLAPYGPHPLNEDDSTRCTCGFSAVVNRRLSHRAGLFYEDEFEITGIADEPNIRNGLPALDIMTLINGLSTDMSDTVRPIDVLSLMKEQCGVIVRSPASALVKAAQKTISCTSLLTANVLELADSNEASWVAMEQGLMVNAARVPCMHRWPFLRAAGPECSQDIVRVMKSLQPQLQEAVQGKCTTRLWEAPYTVSGPLTWRQFHRLAGRGTEDRCEPQPIPSMMVGYEKDWLSLSPHALHYWEKLLLEPYSYARDVAYIVVAPDNDFVINRCRSFFKELSTVYEVCRLGRHCPITKVLRDGILRVGSSAAIKLAKEPIDDWFAMLGDTPTANMLRLYAQVCRQYLVPHLSTMTLDKTLLESSESPQLKNVERPAPSPMPPPSVESDKGQGPNTPKSDHDGDGSRDPLAGVSSSQDTSHLDDEEREPPAVVIYLVEPFTVGSESTEVERLACIGLLKCFSSVVQELPENLRNNMAVQVVSLESLVEQSRSGARSDYMRSTALSVYSQCRRVMQHTSNVKALTGFGPAATGDLFLKNKDQEKNRAPYRLYSAPFILAPVKEKSENAEASEECCVLYISYCLSEDQRWLLASATDERGAILDTTVINIHIPNRSRRKKASARRIGLQKLMDFILGVMSQSVRPWRLVVGRIGRIGHGELKGWSGLLSRQALLNASKHLKEICGQCVVNVNNSVPCILSACLVSLEPDSALRLMPDQFTPDERFSQTSVNCQLSTPQDVTCTHILVFPTSATTQSSQTAFQEQHITGHGELDLFLVDEDISEGIDDLGGFGDIFWQDNPTGGHSPGNSPRRDSPNGMNPSSPTPDASGNYNTCHAPARGGEQQEEVCSTLLQQPLALGYLVSTAPTGPMPSWFWASCPHLENTCPCFLKNALHLCNTIQSSSEDLLNNQQTQVSGHPLDSQVTTDILRYVLEGYNALSWLGLDSDSHDRLSCLPVHMQVLMQLYHMTSTLV